MTPALAGYGGALVAFMAFTGAAMVWDILRRRRADRARRVHTNDVHDAHPGPGWQRPRR